VAPSANYSPGAYATSRGTVIPTGAPRVPAAAPVPRSAGGGYQAGGYAAARQGASTGPSLSLLAGQVKSPLSSGGGGGGLFENLVASPLRTVAALGPGLAHLGVQAAQTAGKVAGNVAMAPVHIAKVAAGAEDPSHLLSAAAALNLPVQIAGAVAPAISEATGKDLPGFTQAHQALASTAPLSSDFSESAGRTAGRVTHPSRYGEAWSQGQFFPAALEDVANLSMLAGAGASALSSPVRGAASAPVAFPEEAAAAGDTLRGGLLKDPNPGRFLPVAQAAPGEAGVIEAGRALGPTMPPGEIGLAPGTRLAAIAHDVAQLGEKAAGGVAKPWEFAITKGLGGAFKLAAGGRPFSQVVEEAAQELTKPRDPNAPRPSSLTRAVQRLAFKITPEGADLRTIMGQHLTNTFDALHQAAEASNVAREIDATPEETMAAVLIADQRLGPLAHLYGELNPQEWNRTIDDVFKEVPQYQRPNPGSVKLALEADAMRKGTPVPDSIGGPSTESMGRITQVLDAIGNVAGRATESALNAQGWAGNVAGLNPEQLGTEPLSAAAEKLRQPLEQKREGLIPRWNRQAEATTRNQRIADAHTAAFAEIRPSATPSAMFARGKAAGRLIAEETRAKTSARAVQSSLAKAVDDYSAAVDRGDANVSTLAGNVDMLTAKANDALAEVNRAERELQARRGLRRASGQAVPAATPEEVGAAAPLGATIPMTTGRAPTTPAIERQIGAAEQRVTGAQRLAALAKRAVGKGETEFYRAAQAGYEREPAAADVLQRAETKAMTAEDAAQRAAQRSQTGQELLAPTRVPKTAEETAQLTRLPESSALSSAQRLGRLNERARASAAIERSTRRAIDHVNADIAAIPEKLRQAFPDRVAKLNDRFVNNARKAARDIEKAGTAAPGISAELNSAIDEILAEHGDTPGARLVIPRVIREVFNSVEGMPDDVRSKLDAQLQSWENARAAMMNKVGDIQFQGSPAPFRPPMTTARLGFKSLMTQADERAAAGDHAGAAILRSYAEDIPSTVEAMDKAGISPTFLTGGEAPNVAKPTTSMSLSERKLAAQYKRGAGFGAAALDDVTRRQMQQVKLIVENKTKQLLKERFGRKADSFVEDPSTLTPEELDRAVRAQGYVPVTGDVVAHDTLVVPEHINNELGRYTKQMDDNFFYHLLTRINSGWKTGILALSPRWHLGNIAGNAMMAMVSGGVSPQELVSRLNAIRKEGGGLRELYKAGGAVEGRPAELLNQGTTRFEHQLAQARGPSAKSMGPIGRLAEHSYRVNEFADAMFRTAVYDAKLGQGIPAAAALKQTLNAMGDFSRLTHFERTWVRQALPFYPWLRHQTQAILRLPIEHPARAAWMGHLANMYTDPSMSPTDLRLLGLRTPQSWGPLAGMNLSTINPFADPTRMPLTDLTAIGQAVTPALKFPAALAGLDISKQPPGQFTRPGGKTGYLTPGEALYYGAQQVPFVNTATNLALDPSIARYKTGEPVPSQEGIPTGRNRLSVLMQGLGIPWPDKSITPEKLAAQKAARGG
jgi:hypothetical protein